MGPTALILIVLSVLRTTTLKSRAMMITTLSVAPAKPANIVEVAIPSVVPHARVKSQTVDMPLAPLGTTHSASLAISLCHVMVRQQWYFPALINAPDVPAALFGATIQRAPSAQKNLHVLLHPANLPTVVQATSRCVVRVSSQL